MSLFLTPGALLKELAKSHVFATANHVFFVYVWRRPPGTLGGRQLEVSPLPGTQH